MVTLGNKMGIQFSLQAENSLARKGMVNSSEAPSFQGDDKTPASPSTPKIKTVQGRKQKTSETTEFNSCHFKTAAQIFQRSNKTQI